MRDYLTEYLPEEPSVTLPPFIADSAERAAKSFAQGVLATFVIGDGFDAFHADWGNALSFGVGGAVLSVLSSVISYKVGRSGTASLTAAVEPATRPAGPQEDGIADHAA